MNDFRDREPSCVSAESGNYNGFLWLLTSPAKSVSKGFQLRRLHHFRMSDSKFPDAERLFVGLVKEKELVGSLSPLFFQVRKRQDTLEIEYWATYISQNG
jgi:hypothetical protein